MTSRRLSAFDRWLTEGALADGWQDLRDGGDEGDDPTPDFFCERCDAPATAPTLVCPACEQFPEEGRALAPQYGDAWADDFCAVWVDDDGDAVDTFYGTEADVYGEASAAIASDGSWSDRIEIGRAAWAVDADDDGNATGSLVCSWRET